MPGISSLTLSRFSAAKIMYPLRGLRGPAAFSAAFSAARFCAALGPAASLLAAAWSCHTFLSSSDMSFHSAPSSVIEMFLPSLACLNSSRRASAQSMYAESGRFSLGSSLFSFFSFLDSLAGFGSFSAAFLAFLAAGFSPSASSLLAESLVGVVAVDADSASFFLGLPAFLATLPRISITLNLERNASEGPLPLAHILVLLYHMAAGCDSLHPQSQVTKDSLFGPYTLTWVEYPGDVRSDRADPQVQH